MLSTSRGSPTMRNPTIPDTMSVGGAIKLKVCRPELSR